MVPYMFFMESISASWANQAAAASVFPGTLGCEKTSPLCAETRVSHPPEIGLRDGEQWPEDIEFETLNIQNDKLRQTKSEWTHDD